MRREANAERVGRFLEALGRRARGAGRVFLAGGASAVLLGWREATVDVDLRLDPEPAGAFEAIRDLKKELEINVELAAPDQFIPPLPGWRERSRYIATHGLVVFLHYDFYGQFLAKVERGHAQDRDDVERMLVDGLVLPDEVRRFFEAIRADLIRYPAVDAGGFRRRLEEALGRGQVG